MLSRIKFFFIRRLDRFLATRFVTIEYLGWQNRYKSYYEKYNIDESFYFNGNSILFYGEGKIYAGKNSYIGQDSRIQAFEGCVVKIGDNCSISHCVKIYTQGADATEIINKGTTNLIKKGDVLIGNNCWIGANVFIREGVKIGDNVVVGANSVVTKDIPSNCVVAGVPAVIVRCSETLNLD